MEGSAISNHCEHSCERGCGTGKAETGWVCWPGGSLLLHQPLRFYLWADGALQLFIIIYVLYSSTKPVGSVFFRL